MTTLDKSSFEPLALSQEIAARQEQTLVNGEHLLYALLKTNEGRVLNFLRAHNLKDIQTFCECLQAMVRERGHDGGGALVLFGDEAISIMNFAAQQAEPQTVKPEHILLGIMCLKECRAAKMLALHGISNIDELRTDIKQSGFSSYTPSNFGAQRPKLASQSKLLAYGATDLTEFAYQGKFDPVIGRDKEIDRLMKVLGRRRKNNAILIGDPGVGKTAIAEGLAARIASGDVPTHLQNKIIVSLDLGSIVAGTIYRGQFEQKLKEVLNEVSTAGNIILFIDEVHTLIGAGAGESSLDAANLMKGALARGEFQCFGATTLSEYRKYFEKDAAMCRRFQPILVDSPKSEDTIAILRGLSTRYAEYHHVTISDEAIQAAVKLSDRYLPERFQPDKAIDLIDEACCSVNSRIKPGKTTLVTSADIEQIVCTWTGIPVEHLTSGEAKRLLKLSENIHKQIIGQNHVVEAVANAVRRARSGLKDKTKPLCSFLFLGPTGVGKTELARCLASILFGSMESMIRLDMSEYSEKSDIAKLIGAPPGYIGYEQPGALTEAIRRHPYSILLLDEIEKAHSAVWNLLLQILDNGKLTDAHGRLIDFRNAIVIMTSNVGANHVFERPVGFGQSPKNQEQTRIIKVAVTDEAARIFPVEFLNRIDEMLVFHQLSRSEVRQIVDLRIADLNQLLSEQQLSIKITDDCKDRLVDLGYDAVYGARPLRRAMVKYIENPLSEMILSDRVSTGSTVLAQVVNKDIILTEQNRGPVSQRAA